MKILKNNKKVEFPKKCKCTHCKSILEVEETDLKEIKVTLYDPRDQESFTYKTTGYKCPSCHKETEVKQP